METIKPEQSLSIEEQYNNLAKVLAEKDRFEGTNKSERMESAWTSGKSTLDVVIAMEMDPKTTLAELEEIISPDLSEFDRRRLLAMGEKMQAVNTTIEKLKHIHADPNFEYNFLAQKICAGLQKQTQVPEIIEKDDDTLEVLPIFKFQDPAKVHLGDFSIYIELSDTDYEKVLETNSGGMHVSKTSVEYKYKGEDAKDTVPVIFLKQSAYTKNQDIKIHEDGHNINYFLRESYAEIVMKDNGEIIDFLNDKVEVLINKISEYANTNSPDDVREICDDESYALIIGILLTQAKDEITAEMQTGAGKSYINTLKKSELYDYVHKSLKLEPGSLLYEKIRYDYTEQLTKCSSGIDSTYKNYLKYMPQRAVEFPLMLQKLSILNWKATLSEAGFFEEKTLINSLDSSITSIEEGLEIPSTDIYVLKPEDKAAISILTEFKTHIASVYKENQDHSVVNETKSLLKEYDGLYDFIVGTALYQFNKSYGPIKRELSMMEGDLYAHTPDSVLIDRQFFIEENQQIHSELVAKLRDAENPIELLEEYQELILTRAYDYRKKYDQYIPEKSS